jgi:hypothetical protein
VVRCGARVAWKLPSLNFVLRGRERWRALALFGARSDEVNVAEVEICFCPVLRENWCANNVWT